ncbi:MAG: hypothetical protein CMB99_03155 [Flavobacteriaceae bacterium]|nr:hypothetical protein [Flavobacteriaceae bacterium]|tara:strand:- start:55878 stop:57005 length:1128 start_codon:yes stop_codon:yes gene_type:complete
MDIFNKSIGFLLISAIGISLFVCFHLIRHGGLKLVNRRIAIALQLLWILRFGLSFIKGDNELMDNPHLVIYDQALFFLDGLLVWLYVRSLLQPKKSFRKVWWHFIPFLFVFLYSAYMAFIEPEFVLQTYNDYAMKLNQTETIVSFEDVIFITFLLGITLIYLFLSVRITTSYNQELKLNFSNIDHLTINWVQKFQWLWIAFFVIPFVVYFINYMFPFTNRIVFGNILIILFVLLSMVFNFFLLEQVYKPVSIINPSESVEKEIVKADKNQKEVAKLKNLLATEEYYLDDELSLGSLAEYMQMKPAELTALIKSTEYENFYDLINSYRVEAIKKQLKETNEQVIQLAYQNGFRSKSTFNKIFKEKTGMTPKEYRLS